MNKNLSKTLITFIAILGIGFLLSSPASVLAQAVDPLVVQFERTPLFKDADLKPGQLVNRWIRVTNNSGEIKKIAIEAINFANPLPADDLARALEITIQDENLYVYGPVLLSDFYAHGETYLSNLGISSSTYYNITVFFPEEKGNEWQNKTTSFDVKIGFQGAEGGSGGTGGNGSGGGNGGGGTGGNTGGGSGTGATTGGGSGGGSGVGGGGLSSELTITNETATTTCNSATITWLTSYSATTQVVYSRSDESHTFNLYATNYGYSHAYPNPEDSIKITGHTVIIPSLTPGATYYYRAVSRIFLPSISLERTFTTKPNIPGCPYYNIPESSGTPSVPSGATGGSKLPNSGTSGGISPIPSGGTSLPPSEDLEYPFSGGGSIPPVSDNGTSTTSEEELGSGSEAPTLPGEKKKNINFLTGAILPAFKYFSTVCGRLLLLLALIILYLLLDKMKKKKAGDQVIK